MKKIYSFTSGMRNFSVHAKQYKLLALLSIAVILVASIAHGGESTKAVLVVKNFQSALIEVMKVADKISVAERYKRLEPAVQKSFHLPLMAQISASSHWKLATRDEKIQLITAFRRMSVATLATLFSSYSGEKFEIVAEKPGPSKTTIVMCNLVKSDKSTVDIAYITKRFKDGWRLIDVVLDSGISELKIRRSEYHQVLRQAGVPALISLLNNKADQLMSQ